MLGPTFAPLLGSSGKAAAVWFIMLNMFHGTHAASGRRRAHAFAAQRRRTAAALPGAGASSTDARGPRHLSPPALAIVFLAARRSRSG